MGNRGEKIGPPPGFVGGARVVQWAIVDHRVTPTGRTVHRIGSEVAPPAAALAICQDDGNDSCYLFSCDAHWNVFADTWHGSLSEAMRQAEHEYQGLEFHGPANDA